MKLNKLNHLALLSLVTLLLAVPACDGGSPECEKLAKHVTEVLAKEKSGIPDEAKNKAIKDMTAACNQEIPEKEVLDCALAAETRDALIACDPKEEKVE